MQFPVAHMQHTKTSKTFTNISSTKLLKETRLKKVWSLLSSMHTRRQKRDSKLSSIFISTKLPQLSKNQFPGNFVSILQAIRAVSKLPAHIKKAYIAIRPQTTLDQNKSIYHRPHIPHEFKVEFASSQTLPVRWVGTNRCISKPPLAKPSVCVHA